jgi:hypothetical protein
MTEHSEMLAYAEKILGELQAFGFEGDELEEELYDSLFLKYPEEHDDIKSLMHSVLPS